MGCALSVAIEAAPARRSLQNLILCDTIKVCIGPYVKALLARAGQADAHLVEDETPETRLHSPTSAQPANMQLVQSARDVVVLLLTRFAALLLWPGAIAQQTSGMQAVPARAQKMRTCMRRRSQLRRRPAPLRGGGLGGLLIVFRFETPLNRLCAVLLLRPGLCSPLRLQWPGHETVWLERRSPFLCSTAQKYRPLKGSC